MGKNTNIEDSAFEGQKKTKPYDVRGPNRTQAAGYVGVGITLFDTLVKSGTMPEGKMVAGRRIWDKHQIDDAMDGLFEAVSDPLAAYGQHV